MTKIHITEFLENYYTNDPTHKKGFSFQAKDISFYQGKQRNAMDIESIDSCWFNLEHFGIKAELNHIKRTKPETITTDEFVARTKTASAWVKCENGYVELKDDGHPLHDYPEDGSHIIFRTPRGSKFSYIERHVENGAQQNARIHLSFEDAENDNELNFVFAKQLDKNSREGKKFLLTSFGGIVDSSDSVTELSKESCQVRPTLKSALLDVGKEFTSLDATILSTATRELEEEMKLSSKIKEDIDFAVANNMFYIFNAHQRPVAFGEINLNTINTHIIVLHIGKLSKSAVSGHFDLGRDADSEGIVSIETVTISDVISRNAPEDCAFDHSATAMISEHFKSGEFIGRLKNSDLISEVDITDSKYDDDIELVPQQVEEDLSAEVTLIGQEINDEI